MKHFLLTLFISFIYQSFGQAPPIVFTELGTNPAYCRTASHQSGNGTVYAAASGGVPDYTYQWTYLVTGETSVNSTWGGRNPGSYEIMVTDEEGTTLIDTVYIDSLNPIASFNVISDDLSWIPDGYIGDAPAYVAFENTSQYFANPYDPYADTLFFFKPQGFEDWTLYSEYDFSAPYTYEYGGTHTARLVAVNGNGCKDTAAVTIGIFGPLDIEDNDQLGFFSLLNSSNQITIQKSGFEEGLILNLYSLSGQQIKAYTITDSKTDLTLNIASGIYVYEVIDPVSGRLRDSGKLNF